MRGKGAAKVWQSKKKATPFAPGTQAHTKTSPEPHPLFLRQTLVLSQKVLVKGFPVIKELDSGNPFQLSGTSLVIAYHRGIIGIDRVTEAIN